MVKRLYSICCAVTFALAGSGAVFAADMPVKALPPAIAPPAPAYTWTSCYIGGNLGGAWDHIWNKRTAFGGGIPVSTLPPVENDRGRASVGGGQIGCDYQLNRWVFGIQAQDDWGNINSTHPGILFPAFDYNTSVKGYVTYTGRIGYAVVPQALLYVKGGGAWTNDNITVTNPSGGFLSEFANNVNFNGWTIGGGARMDADALPIVVC